MTAGWVGQGGERRDESGRVQLRSVRCYRRYFQSCRHRIHDTEVVGLAKCQPIRVKKTADDRVELDPFRGLAPPLSCAR